MYFPPDLPRGLSLHLALVVLEPKRKFKVSDDNYYIFMPSKYHPMLYQTFGEFLFDM